MDAFEFAVSRYVRAVLLMVSLAAVDTSLLAEPRVGSFEARTQRVPRKEAWSLHFRADDVVRYFVEALEVRPKVTREGQFVFEDSKSEYPEDRYQILISQENGDVVVSFSVGGDYGMNLAREFFECPLFNRRESEQLYALLNEAPKAPVFKMGRFNVSARLWETRDRIHLVLRFFRPESLVRS